jgi:cell division protease FtsH
MERKTEWNVGYTASRVEPVSYSEFERALEEGRIAEVLIPEQYIGGELKSPEWG